MPLWGCCHFTWPIDNAANSKANIEATKLSLFSFRCCFALITSRCPCLPSTPAMGRGRRWTGLPGTLDKALALALQGLLQARASLYPQSACCPPWDLGSAHKQTLCWLSICPLPVCRMPHAACRMPPRLAVPSGGSAASSVLSSSAYDRQSSKSCLPQSSPLPPPASLPFPSSHTHTHIASFLWPFTSVFFLFHSFICRFSFCLSFSFDFVVFTL